MMAIDALFVAVYAIKIRTINLNVLLWNSLAIDDGNSGATNPAYNTKNKLIKENIALFSKIGSNVFLRLELTWLMISIIF